ncbi:MAG: CotH kinase family protein, partial [Niabella sp.]
KIGELMDMPYVNHIIPVELTINGVFKGSYVFTEQVERSKSRVNIAKEDLLLELDRNYDEDFQFKSTNYNLPVMVKNPELVNTTDLDTIKTLFQQMENLVAASNFPNNNYLDFIDADALAKYLIIYTLTDNEEINHPKSTYMYKTGGGKFTMGPIWDFDWAYSYEGGSGYYFTNANRPLFWVANTSPGSKFFSRIFTDPHIKTLYKQKWTDFKTNKFPVLLKFVQEYADLIETSRNTDFSMWHSTGFNGGTANFKSDVSKLINWLNNRANYIDNLVAPY